MAAYVIGDIHGMYDQFIQLINKIEISDEDELIFIGDIADRGPDGVKVWKWIMEHQNQCHIVMGNHELMLTDYMTCVDDEKRPQLLALWLANGGEPTLKAIKDLPREEALDLISFIIHNTYLHLEIDVEDDIGQNKKYYLTHGWYSKDDSMSDTVWDRPQWDTPKAPEVDGTMIIGHTPSYILNADKYNVSMEKYVKHLESQNERCKIYHGEGWINVDCGSGRQDLSPAIALAALRIDDLQEFYV